jgi:hypothetical protein
VSERETVCVCLFLFVLLVCVLRVCVYNVLYQVSKSVCMRVHKSNVYK